MAIYVDNPVDQNATIAANATSTVYSPPNDPDLTEHRVQFLASAAGATGTSPTLSFQLQGSLDGVNWFNIGSPVQLTGAGSGNTESLAELPFYQVVKTVGGTSPSFTGVNSHLVFVR